MSLMPAMHNKPALKLLLPFLFGLIVAHHIDMDMAKLVAACGLCLILAVFSFYRKLWLFFDIVIITGFFLAGFLRLELRTHLLPQNHVSQFNDIPELVSVEGDIRSPVEKSADRIGFTLSADTLWVLAQPVSVTGRIEVKIKECTKSMKYGDRVVLKGRLREPLGERNPGAFDYRKYLQSRDVYSTFYASGSKSCLVLDSGRGSRILEQIVYPARRYVVRFTDATLEGQSAALLKGLLVGERGEIDPDVKKAFSQVGVIHVLAVSGLHVGFIVVGLFFLLKIFRIPRPWREWLAICGLLLYMLLTGAHPPVVRASIMAVVLILGRILQRRGDVINSIALAALIILLINPLELFGASFQLSFAAVAGIVLIYQSLDKIFRERMLRWQETGKKMQKYFFVLLLVSISAQLATLPLTAFYFGIVPLLSCVANLVVIPLVGAIVGLGYISVLTSIIYFPLGAIYANANWLLLKALLFVVRAGNYIPFSHLCIYRPSLATILVYFSLIGIFLLWNRTKFRNRAIIALLVCINILLWYDAYGDFNRLKMTFFDVGQGDSALLEFPGDKTLLIDTGEADEEVNYAENVLLPYLQRNGIKKIDILIGTHPHSDHIGGVPFLLEHIKVGRFVVPKTEMNTDLTTKIDSIATFKHVSVESVTAGDSLLISKNVLLMVLHPNQQSISKVGQDPDLANNVSIILLTQFGKVKVLFTGDAEKDAEEQVFKFNRLLRADILKVGHHGSSTSSSQRFRELVEPRYGVVSVGLFNRHRLPSQKVIDDWTKLGTIIARTDRDGAVVFSTDGKNIKRAR
jgi:competence protein ComEC